ncbi:MAG: hypothetical protein J0I06_16200 [Planctomycetes bacterium]|nr:hypothetical protein [Planctomycetota bacterium]
MPIRFRCSYCNRLLGIATRKAGTETTCPHCGYTITVPVPQENGDGRTERMNLDDVEAALGQGATEVVPPQAAVAAPPAPVEKPRAEAPKPVRVSPKPVPVAPKAHAAPVPAPVSSNPDERPLFERDMDEILGKTAAPVEDTREKPRAVSGMDALSVGEPTHNIVISAQKATFLMVLVVVLLVLAFAAGYFVAPRG